MPKVKITPKCKNGWPQYVSAEGQWFPCWFVSHAHRFWRTDFFVVHKDKFNLNSRTLEEILRDPLLLELERSWSEGDPRKIPYKCRRFCGETIEDS